MTEQSKGARPSQVTMAGWVALIGSVLLVLTLFDSVAQLRTVEFRDTIDEFLSTPPGNGLGLDHPQVIEILRVLMLFSGAAAAAATVLAIYVLQRNNAARVGFTIAAVAIMLTAPVSGGFLPVMIAFAAMMLWTKPARDWFAGVPASSSGDAASGSQGTFAAAPSRPRVEGNALSSENHPPQDRPENGDTQPWPRMPEDASGRPVPPPTQGYGTAGSQGPQGQPGQPGQGQGQPGPQGGPSYPQGGYPPPPPYGQQPPYGQPYGGQQPPQGTPPYAQQGPHGYPQQYGQQYGQPSGQLYYGAPQRPGDPNRRPTTVTVAVWITWALSALSILGFVMIGFVLGVARDEFLRQLEQDPNFDQLDVQTDQVVAALWVMGAVALFWGIAAMVLAWFTYRRANWARITLVVSSAMTVLFSLVAFPVGLLHTLGAGAVVVLLFMGGANEWFAGRSGSQGGYPGPFQPYGQQPGQPYGQQPQQYGQQPQQYGDPTGQQGRPEEPPRDRGKDEPPSNVW